MTSTMPTSPRHALASSAKVTSPPAGGHDHTAEHAGEIGTMSHQQILQSLSGLLIGMFVAMLSSTVVTNALPTIIEQLHGAESGDTWVVVATLLALTATTPIWGKLSDLMSPKLLVQLSLLVYVGGSAIAGLSQSVGMLISARAVQGIGAGGLLALVQVIMARMIAPRERGRYSGYLGAVFALATVLGPLVGAVIVDTSWLGWRWCFYVGVPFALMAIVVLQRTLKLPTIRREAKIDYLGAALIVAGVSLLLIWVSLAGVNFAWASVPSALMLIGGIGLLGGVLLTVGLAVLATMSSTSPYWVLGVGMVLAGSGMGATMQNLVLAVQNSVSIRDIGSASATVSFIRSLGGAIGVSALGAVLAGKVTSHVSSGLAQLGVPAAALGSSSGTPNSAALPVPIAAVVQESYGIGTAWAFGISAVAATIGAIVIFMIKETPLRSSNTTPEDAAMVLEAEVVDQEIGEQRSERDQELVDATR